MQVSCRKNASFRDALFGGPPERIGDCNNYPVTEFVTKRSELSPDINSGIAALADELPYSGANRGIGTRLAVFCVLVLERHLTFHHTVCHYRWLSSGGSNWRIVMNLVITHSVMNLSFLFIPVIMALGCTPASTAEHAAEASVAPAKIQASAAQLSESALTQSSVNALASAPVSALTPEARTAVKDVLTHYESLHVQLAADKADGVAETATRLEQAAMRAAALVPTPLQMQLKAVAASTSHITQGHAKNLEEMRGAFGGISRAIIAVLSAEPTLAQGLDVIECPMATGYKKWVQPAGTVSNPYMGTKMATCGVESTWND